MVQKSLIGRLMDIFYNRSSAYNEIMRDYKEFPFTQCKVNELGIPKIEELVERTKRH